MSAERRATLAAATPLQRPGRPDDIARAVLYFASPMSDYVTGQMLLVDGGIGAKFPLGGVGTHPSEAASHAALPTDAGRPGWATSRRRLRPMDIEEFYDADPRRRESEEVAFGHEWTDADGGRYEVMWVADTGEVYAMFEPVEPMASDGIGDIFPQHMPTAGRDGRGARHRGRPATRSTRCSPAGRTAMPASGSIAWVRERIPSA